MAPMISSLKRKTREYKASSSREISEPAMEKTKCFFKYFNPKSSSQKMKIPPAYTRYMGGKLPRKLSLRDRYKNMWQVEVGKSGDDLFLEDGWVKFIQDNSLEQGDFLVFDYIKDAKALFDVRLFGHNCCEKIGVGRPNFMVKEEVEWVDEDEHPEEEEEEAWKPSDSSEDEEEWDNATNDDEDQHEEEKVKEEEDDDEEEEEEEEEGEEGRGGDCKRAGPKRKPIDYSGADIFKLGLYPQPTNPYFVVKLDKRRKHEQRIPKDVIRDFKLTLPPKMTLRDPMGRKWKAKVKTWKDGRVVLAEGWQSLCKWNLIREEDSCICEFVSKERGMGRKKLLLQVHVVRGPQA